MLLPDAAAQFPYAVRPISLVYSIGMNATAPGASSTKTLRMSACTLASILKGDIKRWAQTWLMRASCDHWR
jgi:hypothetical protein